MSEDRQQCQALTQQGVQCRNDAQSGSLYCHIHMQTQKRGLAQEHAAEGEEEMTDNTTHEHGHTGHHSGSTHTGYQVKKSFPCLVREKFTYMGKQVEIAMNDAGDAATLTIDGKPFEIMLHTAGTPADNYIKLWMCEDAYTMKATPELMAKHIINYWYQFAS